MPLRPEGTQDQFCVGGQGLHDQADRIREIVQAIFSRNPISARFEIVTDLFALRDSPHNRDRDFLFRLEITDPQKLPMFGKCLGEDWLYGISSIKALDKG